MNNNIINKYLDKNNPIPLYYQLKTILREEIENEKWNVGEKIPTEKELANLYHISITTSRQALNALVIEGLLVRHQGKGTFVENKKLDMGPIELESFTEQMAKRGMKSSSKVLHVGSSKANKRITSILKILPESNVIFIQRLRFANDEPMGIQNCYIPKDFIPDLKSSDVSGSLYELLENKYQLKIANAIEKYSSIILGKSISKLLHLNYPAVGFMVERTAFLSNGKPIEFAESIMRGDRYSISINLVRRKASNK